MMAAELRSPHERRSDQLSILTRRPPPPPSPGRFAKTLTDAACVGAFDPAFDSDADTDGPPSGSALWRSDFSRVLSASSGMASVDGVDGSAVLADVDALVADPTLLSHPPANTVLSNDDPHLTKSPSPQVLVSSSTTTTTTTTTPAPTPTVASKLPAKLTSFDGDRALSDEQTPPPGTFSRERACSFYGRASKEADITTAATPDAANPTDELGPVSRAQLRAVLDDDYDLFFDSSRGRDVKDLGSEEGSPAKSDSTTPDSPEMKEKGSGDGSECGRKGFGRKMRSFKLFASEERLTVSLVSGSEESSTSGGEDLEITGTELNHLLAGALERPRLSSSAVPLFVEEAGRIPRAAIVDGKMQRVKVKKKKRARGKERREKGRGFVGKVVGGCLANVFEEDVKRRRKGRKRKRKKGAGKAKNLW